MRLSNMTHNSVPILKTSGQKNQGKVAVFDLLSVLFSIKVTAHATLQREPTVDGNLVEGTESLDTPERKSSVHPH